MWDLPHALEIQHARDALKKGNLDKAFHIVTDDDMKDFQQCRKILEQLVDPYLKRAQEHLRDKRLEDALADVEKAQRAGGNRPSIAGIREEILNGMHKRRQNRYHLKKALESAQEHINKGRLDEGAKLLNDDPLLSSSDEKAEALRRHIEILKNRAGELRTLIGQCLKKGELEEAVSHARLLRETALQQPDTQAVLKQVCNELEREIRSCLNSGSLVKAKRLLHGAAGLQINMVRLQECMDAVHLIDRASTALGTGDWSGGRTYLSRLKRILPKTSWIADHETRLKTVEEIMHELASGPLMECASTLRKSPPSDRGKNDLVRSAAPAESVPDENHRTGASEAESPTATNNFILWVDGVGSYLLLQSDQVTLGRSGSSAEPDLPLPADIEGIHARILRVDDDYFFVPQGAAMVNGKTASRHLLSDGDDIAVGADGHITFRLPTALSSTAILELNANLRISGDIRNVVLLDKHLIFGPPGGAHIPIPGMSDKIVLSVDQKRFRCHAPVPVIINDSPQTRNASIPVGAHVNVNNVTFTLTELQRGCEAI